MGNDTASVGYFKTTLQNGVTAELSASQHAGIAQYSFPSGEKHILVDVSHVSASCRSHTGPAAYSNTSTSRAAPAIQAPSFTLEGRSKLGVMASYTKDMEPTLADGTMVCRSTFF